MSIFSLLFQLIFRLTSANGDESFFKQKWCKKTVFIMNGLWGQIAYPSKKWLALPFLIQFAIIFPNCGILFKDKGNYFSSLYSPHIMITMKENLRKKTQHETFDWAFFFKLQYRARLNKKKVIKKKHLITWEKITVRYNISSYFEKNSLNDLI